MTIVRCKSCLYPTTKPDLHFVDGECAACRNYKRRSEIDWDARLKAFLEILDKAPRGSSGYDCIVPSSGGKDSTYQVLALMDMGMRPLVVTSTTCQLTDVGKKNIINLSKYATTIEYTPNISVRSRLNRIGLRLLGDISLPEHMAIFSIPFRAAVDFGIPLVIYGECPTMEYGGPPNSEDAMSMTKNYIMEHQGFMGMRPSDFIGQDGITKKDMMDYMLPPQEQMDVVRALFLGQYVPWCSNRNAYVAKGAGLTYQLPCEANWWDHENLDNAQTGIHDFFGYLKFGYGRGAAQLSVDIRSNWMTRKEAWKIAKSKEGVFPASYMGVPYTDVLDHIGITGDEFRVLMKKFTNKSLFSTTEPYRLIPNDMQ